MNCRSVKRSLGLVEGIDYLTEYDSHWTFWTPSRDCIHRWHACYQWIHDQQGEYNLLDHWPRIFIRWLFLDYRGGWWNDTQCILGTFNPLSFNRMFILYVYSSLHVLRYMYTQYKYTPIQLPYILSVFQLSFWNYSIIQILETFVRRW